MTEILQFYAACVPLPVKRFFAKWEFIKTKTKGKNAMWIMHKSIFISNYFLRQRSDLKSYLYYLRVALNFVWAIIYINYLKSHLSSVKRVHIKRICNSASALIHFLLRLDLWQSICHWGYCRIPAEFMLHSLKATELELDLFSCWCPIQ